MAKENTAWTIVEKTEYLCNPGAVKEKDGIRFTVAVPTGKKASLLLYMAGEKEPCSEIAFPETSVMGNLHSMKVVGLPWQKYEYNYKIDDQIIQDPYAVLIAGRETFGEKTDSDDPHQVRCRMSYRAYQWDGDVRLEIPYEDAVMYHLHVRNYTMHKKSGVRHKGTFRGLEEKIPYLKELGINQVKLMPVYEFDEFPGQEPVGTDYKAEMISGDRMNCWGYGKGFYFAPKKSYAYSNDAPAELKHMIRAFHQNGIEVILDFCFSQGTSVRLITDCLLYWIREYHVDGFHVIGADEAVRMLVKDPAFAKTKMYCIYYPENQVMLEKGEKRNAAELNDGFMIDMRRILKGDEGALEHMAYRNRRNHASMAVVNYITNHDGFTLRDLVSYDNKHNEENGERGEDGSSCNFSWNCGVEGESRKKPVIELRNRQMKNAILLMMFSQGVPMLLGGDEFGNSQNGNNNPYCLDNEISWVSWNRYSGAKSFAGFVKDAIAFRKAHPILHLSEELKMMDYKACGYPDLSYHSENAWYGGFDYNSRHLGMMYCEKYCGTDTFLYVAYNFHPLEQKFALPKLPKQVKWSKVIDTSIEQSFTGEIEMEEDRVFSVPSRSIIVLIGKEA